MIRFIWYLLWIIQGLLIAAKVFDAITTSWWGVFMPIILLVSFFVLCLLVIILFAWAVGDAMEQQDYDY